MAKRTLRTPGVRRSLRPRASRTVSGFAPPMQSSAPDAHSQRAPKRGSRSGDHARDAVRAESQPRADTFDEAAYAAARESQPFDTTDFDDSAPHAPHPQDERYASEPNDVALPDESFYPEPSPVADGSAFDDDDPTDVDEVTLRRDFFAPHTGEADDPFSRAYASREEPADAPHGAHDAHQVHSATRAAPGGPAEPTPSALAAEPSILADGSRPRRAAADDTTGEPSDQLLMASFFSEPPAVPEQHDDDADDPASLPHSARRAMWASAGIFAASIICIASYAAYHNYVMPAPAELGGAGSELAMPVPLPVSPTQESVENIAGTLPNRDTGSSVLAVEPAAAAPGVSGQPLSGQALAAPSGLVAHAALGVLPPSAAGEPLKAHGQANAPLGGGVPTSAAVNGGPVAPDLREGSALAAPGSVSPTAAQRAAAALAAHIGPLPSVPSRSSEADAASPNTARPMGTAPSARSGELSLGAAATASNAESRAPGARADRQASAELDLGSLNRASVPSQAAETSTSAVRAATAPGAAAAREDELHAAQSAAIHAAELPQAAVKTSSTTIASTSAASAAQYGAHSASAQIAAAPAEARLSSAAASAAPAASSSESALTGQPRAALVAGSASALDPRSTAFSLGSGSASKPSSAASGPSASTEPRPKSPPANSAATERNGAILTPTIEPEAANALQASYEDLIEVGRGFARKNRSDEALEAFRHALDLEPNGVAALGGIAYVYLNLNDAATAKLYAIRTLQTDPTDSQGWIVLGAALEELGDRVAAREAYRRCATEGTGSYVAECRALAPR